MSAQHTPVALPLHGSLAGKDPADMSAVELQTLVYSLRAQRDELLAELQRIADAKPSTWDPETRDQFQQWAQNRARHTIAKVTGGNA